MDRIKEAIEYFDYEISQYRIMSGGVLSDNYRNYVEKKIRVFELAREYMLKELNENELTKGD